MGKEDLRKIARSLGSFESVTKGGTPVFEFTPMLLEWFVDEILERAATVAEHEPKVWDLNAPSPQQRIATKIRAMKGDNYD